MEHTENPPYRFWHQGIVNNNIDSSVNMEAVSRTLPRLVLIKGNKSSNLIKNMGLFHRDKKNNDDEPDSVQTNSFSDIMNGLQYAVNCAQDTLQNHQIQNLTRLFEGTNANNANTFQSKKIMVGDKTIDIPLIALISHHYLAMDNVQIKFKAKVGSVESQIPENNLLLSSPQRANLQMQMSNIKPDADDVMEVCVNFKVQETPESISRIIDDFVKNI